ncbi:hypothetical protein TrRE_jg6638 [Triparma retinervis]|uniref:SET domain-containing protein n=1 Tax=Triparma retinervis TaxID=2557542 RepID=A0A9W6Z8K9_9STRA|nr:hypothetical protein TrRE_jg6638 [Triparma retinervis]
MFATLISTLLSLSFALSTCLSDVSIESWSSRAGIIKAGVVVSTDERSIAGRGIFATRDIREGEVVASIPSGLVLLGRGDDWAGEITNAVKGLKGGGGEQAGIGEDVRREWIDGWGGGGCKSWDDVCGCVGGEGAFVGREGLREMVRLRIEDRLEVFRKIGYLDESDLELYALVCSRACHLGPSWGEGAVGVIPLFDYLNHHDDPNRVNVGLESFGQVLSRTPEGPGRPDPGMMNERDMLIIAKKNVKKGEELLTSYVDKDDEGGDVRKIVTWGFSTLS